MFRWTILDGNCYVDSKDGSDMNAGTMAAPVRTLNKAQQLCTIAGQKVVVRGNLKYDGTFASRSFGLVWVGDGKIIIDGNMTVPVFRAGDDLTNFKFVNGNTKQFIVSGANTYLRNSVVSGYFYSASDALKLYAFNCSLNIGINHIGGGITFYLNAVNCVIYDSVYNRTLQVTGSSCYFKNNVSVFDATFYSANQTTVPVPKFADETRLNFHLLPDSPLIGQGLPDVLNGTRKDIGIGGIYFGLGVASPETFEANGAVWTKTGTLNHLYVDTDRWVKRVGVASGSITTTAVDLTSEYFIDDILQNIFQDFSGMVPTGGVPALSFRYGLTSAEMLAKPYTLIQFDRRPTVDASGDGNGSAAWDAATAKPIKARFLQFTFTISDSDF